MSRYVELGTDRPSRGLCVVLPGRQYTCDAPLLFFATHTLLAHGWDVRHVWWEAPGRDSLTVADEVAWVEAELAAALEGYDGRVLVLGKSLGTLATAAASDRAYDAVWLTPLLTEPSLAAAHAAYAGRQLVVIGDADPYLDRDVLASLPGRQVVVPGDHVLVSPGEPLATVDSHRQVVAALDTWLESIG